MTPSPTVLFNLKDVELDEELRAAIERRCQALAEEFHEIGRFEISIEPARVGFHVNGHATGKNTDVATHVQASEIRPAADKVLDRIEKQLRRLHDKRIFAQRREAQRDPPKRRQGG